MEWTPFAGLTALDENDPITIDGASFLIKNPRITDHLLQVGAVTHRHDAHIALPNPAVGMTGTTTATGGRLAASAAYALTYTILDAFGGETLPAPPLLLTTGGEMGAPTVAPSTAVDYTTGIMPAGAYYYAMTYTDGAGGETTIGPTTLVYVDPGFASASVDLSQLSTELTGGETWRLWRSYEGADWHLVTEGTANTFVDGGFDPPDNPARPPDQNTTNQQYLLNVTLPTVGAVPPLASGSAIRVYLAPDTGFLDPCFYAQYPIASAGALFTITVDSISTGSPPHVSTSLLGAAKINPDTDILDWHWKRPVATQTALPSGAQADVRMTIDTGHLWGVLGSAAATSADWTDLMVIVPDSDTSPAIAGSGGVSLVSPSYYTEFAGSGGVAVAVQGLGGASARVLIGAGAGGLATLASGVATVNDPSVTSGKRIILTAQDNNSTGALRVSTRTPGTSFTITSSNLADHGVVAYEFFGP
jgi:hypothetical protein